MLKKCIVSVAVMVIFFSVSCKQVRVKSEGTEQLKEEIAFLQKRIDLLEGRISELENKKP